MTDVKGSCKPRVRTMKKLDIAEELSSEYRIDIKPGTREYRALSVSDMRLALKTLRKGKELSNDMKNKFGMVDTSESESESELSSPSPPPRQKKKTRRRRRAYVMSESESEDDTSEEEYTPKAIRSSAVVREMRRVMKKRGIDDRLWTDEQLLTLAHNS